MPTPKVALVTGATRGAGKGIALGLASQGMKVFVTGRSKSRPTATLKGETLSGTLDDTVEAINNAGGQGIAITCDHADDWHTGQARRDEEQQGAEDQAGQEHSHQG